jgi:hypothetical protein
MFKFLKAPLPAFLRHSSGRRRIFQRSSALWTSESVHSEYKLICIITGKHNARSMPNRRDRHFLGRVKEGWMHRRLARLRRLGVEPFSASKRGRLLAGI